MKVDHFRGAEEASFSQLEVELCPCLLASSEMTENMARFVTHFTVRSSKNKHQPCYICADECKHSFGIYAKILLQRRPAVQIRDDQF